MLGDVVRAHRRRLGLSQEDLAHHTGVSVRGIRKIEAHQTDTPRPATVRLLADAFGLRGAERDSFCAAALGPTTSEGTPRPVATSALRPGLVGRVGELDLMHARATATAGGLFQVVWIGGEAGAGKSTLAASFSSTLASRGWHTAWGASPEVEGTPPAWAWADVVRGLTNSSFAGAKDLDDDLADRLRPLLGTEPATPGRPPIAPFWVARAVVDFLRQGAGPLLVVLDDVHRAGEETLQILRYAAAELADRPVLVAATFRPTEVGAALRATWAALAGPRAGRIELGGLTEPDVGRLLRQQIGTAVAPDAVRLIAARTGGNPLFVGETARLIAAEGIAAAAELVPTGVGNLLRHRLAGLPEPARAVLRTAAVFGLDIDTEALLSLDPLDADAVLDGLEAAIHAGLLTEPAPGVVRFSHVLFRDTIYQDLPRLRRARLHAQVLATLERSHPDDVAVLAHHALAAATPATARSAAVRALDAAHAASAVNAHQEAGALLVRGLATLGLAGSRAAAGAGRQPTAPGDLQLDLLCALVSAQGHAGNVRGARASRNRAIRLADQLGGPGGSPVRTPPTMPRRSGRTGNTSNWIGSCWTVSKPRSPRHPATTCRHDAACWPPSRSRPRPTIPTAPTAPAPRRWRSPANSMTLSCSAVPSTRATGTSRPSVRTGGPNWGSSEHANSRSPPAPASTPTKPKGTTSSAWRSSLATIWIRRNGTSIRPSGTPPAASSGSRLASSPCSPVFVT